ncbi:MAG TPA: hypothetical protein VHI13_12970 [Candidatus Kapabacteria bacterium]|nr:hypothetical protein [Candidatus Kapabacteria bacterium]
MNHYLRTRCLVLPLVFALTAGIHLCRAQGTLPFLNGPNNAGREFWLAFPANWDNPTASDYYIRLYIASSTRTQVRVWAGANIRKTLYTRPDSVVTVDLTPVEAQMFTRSDVGPVPDDQIYHGRAIHVDADAPIVVYGMNRTTYTSDGLLALPVNALGRRYIVASYAAVIGGTQELPSQLMVIAPYDHTIVTIEQPMATPNHRAGETVTLTMNQGDVYSAMTLGYGGDMSGAVIRSNKPVAVTAGQSCTYIPNQINYCCCDHLTEMMLPVQAWGRRYQAVPLATRLKGDFYRVFAGADNAKVSINGVEYATLMKAGGGEGSGWIEYRALGKEMVEFSSNKPIMVAQYNTSQAYDNVPSDPFYQMLTPFEQYGVNWLFSTPASDFPQNYINLTVDSATYRQIEIAPAGTGNWTPLWQNAGAATPKPFPTQLNGRSYAGVTIQIAPGAYQLRSPRPLGGHIYGFSAYDSYGYPIAAIARDMNDNDTASETPPPTVAPKITHSIACGGTITANVTSGTRYDERAFISSIDVLGDTTGNLSHQISPYQADTAAATVYFNVIDKQRPSRAIIVAADMSGNVAFDTVDYHPSSAIRSNGFDFGLQHVGTRNSGTVDLTNEGTDLRYITSIGLSDSGDATKFSIEALTLPLALYPGQTRTINVWFAPDSSIAYMATIRIGDSCGAITQSTLTGSGWADVAAVPSVTPGIASAAFALTPNQTHGSAVSAHLTLPAACMVTIAIVDNAGAIVGTPIEQPTLMAAGEHAVPIEVANLPAGRYYCRIACGGTVLAQPLTITR